MNSYPMRPHGILSCFMNSLHASDAVRVPFPVRRDEQRVTSIWAPCSPRRHESRSVDWATCVRRWMLTRPSTCCIMASPGGCSTTREWRTSVLDRVYCRLSFLTRARGLACPGPRVPVSDEALAERSGCAGAAGGARCAAQLDWLWRGDLTLNARLSRRRELLARSSAPTFDPRVLRVRRSATAMR